MREGDGVNPHRSYYTCVQTHRKPEETLNKCRCFGS
jgi:hypothetical protein